MDAYEHGFVVKSQKELEELMGPPDRYGWGNPKDEFADAFTVEMMKYIGRPSFEKPLVFNDVKERGIKVRGAWGWNFDTRWVHELKRCTFEELVKLNVPFDKVYAVCVPSDIGYRISMRAGLTKDDIDLVPLELAVALRNTVVPDHSFVYLISEVVDTIDYLGHLWLPNELEVLYVEPAKTTEVPAEKYIEKYKGKGVSYRILTYPNMAGVEYVDMSIFDKTYKIDDNSPSSFVIFADRYVIPLGCIWVKVKMEV